MSPIAALWAYKSAFVVHLIALGLYWVFAARPQRSVASMAVSVFSVGAFLQAVFMLAQWRATGHAPLANTFNALCLWTLVVSVVFLAAEWRWRLGLLGAFIAPLVALTLSMGFRFAKIAAQAPPPQEYPQGWLVFHVSLVMAGYAAFTLAFGVALAFLLHERQLKNRKLTEMFYQLPSLVQLESMVFACLGWGVVALGAGLAVGKAWGRFGEAALQGVDPKVAVSGGALVYFASLWLLRRGDYLHGRRAASAVLAGFLLLFFGFYLANTIGGGHQFS